MARTGCAFAAVTCLCCPARTHRDRQVLPAYGLQDLPIKTKNPSRGSKPNTMWLPITLGESVGRGHFYLAETRTFLLCVDTHLSPGHAPVGGTRSWRLKTLIYRIIGMREVGSRCLRLKQQNRPSETILTGLGFSLVGLQIAVQIDSVKAP